MAWIKSFKKDLVVSFSYFYYVQRIKNENPEFISRNSFDSFFAASFEALAREAVAQTDVHVDLKVQTALEPLLDLKLEDSGKVFSHILTKVQGQMEPVIIDNEQWPKVMRYMYYEDRIVLPREPVRVVGDGRS